jgi:hypothetical protein
VFDFSGPLPYGIVLIPYVPLHFMERVRSTAS